MMTQTSAPAPTKDPLTTQDRQIIATIVNHWQCRDGVRYWGVREAVEALRRVTTPVELPRVSRELVAA